MTADFRGLLRLLTEGEVDFVLVGGYSAVLHGSTQMTRDVDIVCALNEASGGQLLRALVPAHPRHRMLPEPRPLEQADFARGELRNLYLKTDLGVLDCLGEVKGIGDLDACRARSEWMELADCRFRILTIEALIDAKHAMARPRDLVTAKELEAIARRTRH